MKCHKCGAWVGKIEEWKLKEKTFREARKGYVRLENVLEILNKHQYVEKAYGENAEFWCIDIDANQEIKALGDVGKKQQ